MKQIRIDRTKRLKDEPSTGHNRWHPDIPPILSVEPGEEVVLETRDARDGQIGPTTTVEDLASQDQKVAHPLTGPIHIDGAEQGDLLEIEYLEIEPESNGWTRFYPGAGFLRDQFPYSFLVHWDLADGWARSKEIPNVRIPCGAFMGTAGLAPSRRLTQLRAKAYVLRRHAKIAATLT
jgi:formamidase